MEDAFAIPKILPSLSLTVMMYCIPERKPTPASVQSVSVEFYSDMDFASPYRCEPCSKLHCVIRLCFRLHRLSSQLSTYTAQMALRIPSFILITWNLRMYYLIRGWVFQDWFRLCCWGKYLNLRGWKWRKAGGDCIIRNFITCTFHQILSGWSNQEGWYERDM